MSQPEQDPPVVQNEDAAPQEQSQPEQSASVEPVTQPQSEPQVEEKKEELCIKSYGLGMTTLEEVFLKVGEGNMP